MRQKPEKQMYGRLTGQLDGQLRDQLYSQLELQVRGQDSGQLVYYGLYFYFLNRLGDQLLSYLKTRLYDHLEDI